ncbi:MAG TPA: DinB family protein [Chryseolinea sp.]
MRTLYIVALAFILVSCSEKKSNEALRQTLLQQLRNSHSEEDWFAPLHNAISGVTVEQASWKDSTDNHSIGQLTSHLVFWNERVLKSFQGNTPPEFKGSNDTTFRQLNEAEWQSMQIQLDSIQRQIEQVVQDAPEEKIVEWSKTIGNLCMHNAYHGGQIVYIRKRNGWWKTH